jgi:hypothetical protein
MNKVLDVREAAKRASEYFGALYSDNDPAKLRLEEVELTEDGQYWLITLSYPRVGLAQLFGNDGPREYKLFKIRADTGEVKSMKIRKIGENG